MKSIGILTNFNSYLRSYSPLIIVGEQIKMLKNAGYEPVVIVTESFEPPEDSVFSSVKLARIPNVDVSLEAKQDVSFEHDVDFLKHSLKKIIDDKNLEVIITHDLIYLPDYVKHRVAAIQLAEQYPNLRWLHWVHSATSPETLIAERRNFEDKYRELLGKKFPNSFIVFPNSYDVPRVARNFGYEEDEVKVVPHSTNYTLFNNNHPIVARLIEEKDLLSADVIMVYPLRLDRGKQPDINVEIIAAVNELNMDGRVIFVDFHSTGGDKVTYRKELKELAKLKGIEDKVIFTSEFDEEMKTEADRKIVSELLELSNVFCLPSKSETYSLVAQEALLKSNFLILNHDFLPMRSIFGDMAIYRQFSSNIAFDGLNGEINTEYDSESDYFLDIARYIKYTLENNKVLRGKTWVRKERNPDAVFRKYLEPLLAVEGDEEK